MGKFTDMNFNVLSFVKEQLSGYVIGKMSDFLGENPYKTASALENVLPVVLAGVVAKARQNGGSEQIMSMISSDGHNGKIFERLNDLVKEPDEVLDWLSSGSALSNKIFGDKFNDVVDSISAGNDVRKTSGSSLISFLSPLIMGALGHFITSKNGGVSDISQVLSENKSLVEGSITEEIKRILGLDSIQSAATGKIGTTATAAKTQKSFVKAGAKKPSTGWLTRWLWPILFLGLLGVAGLFYWKKRPNLDSLAFWKKWAKSDSTMVADTLKDKLSARQQELDAKARELAKPDAEVSTNKSSSSSKHMAEDGGETISLPRKSSGRGFSSTSGDYDVIVDSDGSSSSERFSSGGSVGSGSLNGLASAIKNRNRNAEFMLNGIQFTNGGYEITGGTQQIDQIARIMKQYPGSKIFIQGFVMDGDTEDAELSQMRAEWIRYALIDKGIKASRIESRGHCTADMTHFKNMPPNGISMKFTNF